MKGMRSVNHVRERSPSRYAIGVVRSSTHAHVVRHLTVGRPRTAERTPVAAPGLLGQAGGPNQRACAEVDAVATHRNSLASKTLDLLTAHRDSAVGTNHSMPGNVLRHGGQNSSDETRGARVDVPVCLHETLRNCPHPRQDSRSAQVRICSSGTSSGPVRANLEEHVELRREQPATSHERCRLHCSYSTTASSSRG